MTDRKRVGLGDKGQRYEVRAYVAETGEQIIIGWTDIEGGGNLMKGAKQWPYVRDPFVIDRKVKI